MGVRASEYSGKNPTVMVFMKNKKAGGGQVSRILLNVYLI